MSGVNIITNNGRVSGGGELVTIKVLHQATAALLISLKGFLSPFSLWLHPRPGQCWAVRGILATNTSTRTPRNIGRTLHTYLHFPHHHHLHMHINYCRFRLYCRFMKLTSNIKIQKKIINLSLPLSNYTKLHCLDEEPMHEYKTRALLRRINECALPTTKLFELSNICF